MQDIENILIIDADHSTSSAALEQLKLHGYAVDVLESCKDARNWIPGHKCHAVLFDFHVHEKNELEFMTWLKSYKMDFPVLAMIEKADDYEETRKFCESTGNIPVFLKQFALLDAIDHLERVKRAS